MVGGGAGEIENCLGYLPTNRMIKPPETLRLADYI